MGWGQQIGPLQSDGQGGGGKKKPCTPFFGFSIFFAAEKTGGYKSVTATYPIFFSCKCHPPTPIAHAHGHAKGFGAIWAVWFLPHF